MDNQQALEQCELDREREKTCFEIEEDISDKDWEAMPLSEKIFTAVYGTRPTLYEKKKIT